ncbi:hypothetical protein VZT92_024039 [Zoarces viviparus]|uniref:THAP domain-containing protein 1 n=1 Tax=Zoarces viviparus TaxID=48416 RepID=A0AAW1E0C5_ZOAVI
MAERSCCVLNCSRTSRDLSGGHAVTFHVFPAWRRHEGETISELTRSRRTAWVSAVGREDITFHRVPSSSRVCSRHFYSGKPSYEGLESDPDWVPSLLMGPSEGTTGPTKGLLQSVHRDRDQDQRRSTETRSLTETETAGGAERPDVRPWTEVRPLLQSVLQRRTVFSRPPADETRGRAAPAVKETHLDFRDFIRDALEASLETSSRSRISVELDSEGPPMKEVHQTCEQSSSCENCVRLMKRSMELQEKLSRLTGGPEDVEVITETLLHPDQDKQSPETVHIEEQDPAGMEPPLSSPPAVLKDGERDPDSANKRTQEGQPSKPKPRQPPRFQNAWLKRFWFLCYSPALDLMWCHICRLHSDRSHSTKGLIKGSRMFKLQSILKHSSSNHHKNNESRHMMMGRHLQP